MKKGLGLLAALGATAGYIAYKAAKKHDENESLDDGADIILHNVEKQGFHPIDVDEDGIIKDRPFKETGYPHLSEEDLVRLTSDNVKTFEALGTLDPNEEKPIQHTITFAKEIELEVFKNQVISEGYVVTTGESEQELLVLHISKMDQDDISAKVFYLADLAKANGGEYKGWICKQ